MKQGNGKYRFWRRLRLASLFVGLALVSLSFFSLPAAAKEEEKGMPEGFWSAVEELPEDVKTELPDGLDSDDPEAVGEAVEQMAGAEYLLRFLGRTVGLEMGAALSLMLKLCGILIVGALLGALGSSLSSKPLTSAFQFASTTAIFGAILSTQMELLRSVETYFERLSALMGAMIPVAGTVWAMGGNVRCATVGSSTFYVFLTVSEQICAKTVLPVCIFCLALALCQGLSPELGVKNLASATKKIYTFLLGSIMTLLVASLSSQTALSAAADTVTAKAAKMVAGSVIPVVGGTVGDTLRTVAAGTQYLKSVVGIGGILMILLLVVPTIVQLLLSRVAILLSVGIAELLGCENEGKLLSEIGNAYGCVLAVTSMTAVMFILGLTIFTKSVVAIG